MSLKCIKPRSSSSTNAYRRECNNAMVRCEQLPKWQKNRPPRLPGPYTADSVPNSKKLTEKVTLRGSRICELSPMRERLQTSSRFRNCCLKLVPFGLRTGARNQPKARRRTWVIRQSRPSLRLSTQVQAVPPKTGPIAPLVVPATPPASCGAHFFVSSNFWCCIHDFRRSDQSAMCGLLDGRMPKPWPPLA
jgi:hypothetical protein